MLTDAVLVDRVIAGFDDAFDELYRRHANTAWRVAQAVTGNAHDASDAVSEAFARVLQAVRAGRLADGGAFRSYLLTATRNAALDGLRRRGRTDAAGDEELAQVASTDASPVDRVAGHEDVILVAEAFRNLPERWRSVLWLTEVEGVATKDAADQLGLSPNGTAQLAVRARAGLRERYLQAHVRNHARPECRFTVDHLGAYVGGGISPRDLAKVDQHLAGCEDCRARKEELEDLGPTLRRIALPIPLALGAASALKVKTALAATATPTAGFGARAMQLAKEPTPFMRRVTGASAAGVLALGLLSLGIVDAQDDDTPGLTEPRSSGAAATTELPVATFENASNEVPLGQVTTGQAVATAPPPERTPTVAGAPAGAEQPRSDEPASSPQPSSSDGESTPTTEQPATEAPVSVEVGVTLGDHDAAVDIDLGEEPSVGITIDDTPVIGETDTETPEETGVSVEIGGSEVSEPISVTLP